MKLSASRIKMFKACRRAYELHYIEGLTPAQDPEAIKTGLTYHQKLEEIYKTGMLDITDLSKETAMAAAYFKHIYPHFKVCKAEETLKYDVDGDELVGRVDGIATDGRLVEHKTTSAEITEEYEYELQWDEQILTYMLMTGVREVWYTICRKPTIRQKKDETDEEFFVRMIQWYETDTDSKIRCILIKRTDEEVEAFRKELSDVAREMRNTTCYYKNTGNCKRWGRRCQYASVCLHYDPTQEYIEFTKEKMEER